MKRFSSRLIPQMIEMFTLKEDQGVQLSKISYLTSKEPEDVIMKEIFFSCTRDPLRNSQYDGVYTGESGAEISNIDLKKHCIVKLKKDNLNETNYHNLRIDFVKECNETINSLIKMLKKDINYFNISKRERYLVSFLLSILAITKVKDITNQELDENFLNSFLNSDIKEMSPAKRGHTLAITTLELKENTTYENFFTKHGIDISKWEPIVSDGKCVIDLDKLITKKKGYSIIKCKSTQDNDLEFSFRVICGENIREQKLIYFLDQIRNIIAHGLFVLDQEETRNLACRKVLIKNNNQLNIAYGGNNYFIMEYFPYLATNLYGEDNFELVQNINYFMCNQMSEDVFLANKTLFQKYLLLMKFYVNFIYNMDYIDKNEFNYSLLLKDKTIDATNFFNNLRTAIMHGWYNEDTVNGKEGLNFWCLDKNDREKKEFEIFLTFKQIKLACDNKERVFNNNLKY